MEGEPTEQYSEREQVIAQKTKEGWTLVATEQLFRDVFDSKEGRFMPRQYQTEEELAERYRGLFRQQAKERGVEIEFDIELIPVPPERFQGEALADQYKRLFLFARQKRAPERI